MATGQTSQRPGAVHDGRSGRSTVRLVRDIAQNTSTLIRQELQLFKLELSEAVSARIKAAIAIAVAGVLGLFVLGFLGLAAGAALSGPLTTWAAWLVVAGVFLLLAFIALLFARRRMKVPPLAPEETKRTVKEDVEWAKAQLKR